MYIPPDFPCAVLVLILSSIKSANSQLGETTEETNMTQPTLPDIVIHKSENAAVRNITILLDNLLRGYDKSLRPPVSAGKKIVVKVDMLVLTMGPISEAEMAYSMDCYFRQTWQDSRLQFEGFTSSSVTLHMSMLDDIWKPDTYFWNSRDSYLHKMTIPNKFVRISRDGTVHFSSRLTIKATCPMFLRKFPLDVQKCPLSFGSFAYTADEIVYTWKYGLIVNSSRVSKSLILSQFELKKFSLREDINVTMYGSYSRLELVFLFHRKYGYFLINFYGPCSLIVILSWVAFWINREATADRIGLGVTSILTMTFLFLDSRSDLPRVHYPTALDVYLILCYSFVLGTILEFSVVHTFTKYGTGDPELRFLEAERLEEKQSITDGAYELAIAGGDCIARRRLRKETYMTRSQSLRQNGGSLKCLVNDVLNTGQAAMKKPALAPTTFLPPSLQTLGDLSKYMPKESMWSKWYKLWTGVGKKADPADCEVNSVSKIDRLARMTFPLIFGFASILYWNSYLRKADDEDFGPSGPNYGVVELS